MLDNNQSTQVQLLPCLSHHLHVGDSITPYRTNLDGCGYVVAKASTIEHSIELAAKVRQMIDITILRK